MDRHHIRLLVLGTVVALGVATIVVVVRGNRSHDLVLQIEPIDEASNITVYAGGAVATPGLYTLPVHSRVATLLERAGLSADADRSQLQMAAELRDGQQVVVPTQRPIAATESTATTAAVGSTAMQSPASPARIDVNQATIEELETLPGIGPALAQRVIDYRYDNGPFASLDDLANVKGISARMVDDLRDLAMAGP